MKRRLPTLILSTMTIAALGGLTLLRAGLTAEAAWRSLDSLVTNQYPVTASFTNISITDYYADVELRLSRDGAIRVTTRDAQDVNHSVEVVNGTLTISRPEPTMGERFFHDDDDDPEVILYLPAGNYGALTVSTTSGDIESAGQLNFSAAKLTTTSGDIELYGSVTGDLVCSTTSGDVELSCPTAGAVQIDTTSGDIELKSCYLQSLRADTTSGDAELERVTAAGAITISSTSGDIELEQTDAASLDLSTSSGDVEASLLSGKNFSASSMSGRVNVPASTPNAGACTVSTTSGSIRITVRQ